MKKYIILILSVFILSGCSSQYNLKITSDGIEENIYMEIDKSMIDNQVISSEVEPDDQITPFLTEDTSPFFNSTSKKYNKVVTEDENMYYVKMDYKFSSDNYKNSLALNTCFQNHEYVNHKDYYEIKLSGSFYCLYGDSTEIIVDTPNVVKEHNAENQSGNKYTWNITSSNSDNVNISIKVLKKTKMASYITTALLVILAAVIVIGILIIANKLSNRENLNKI